VHKAIQLFVDNPLKSLVGVNPVKIVCLAGGQLKSRLPRCSNAYVKSFESNIIQHWLQERLYNAHTGEYSAEETARRVIIINKEGKAYMWHA
jgi:hypothetical protein